MQWTVFLDKNYIALYMRAWLEKMGGAGAFYDANITANSLTGSSLVSGVEDHFKWSNGSQ